ncbi:MAG TPA: hypothetical protein VN903_17960 [Polyangia bacterium]|jgi:hypothetical protein|nr:hypothetical protein [Polyangia bacterium]
MRRFLALCASAALAVAVAASGCGSYPVSPESGGSKGPEMKATAQNGLPMSASASQMAQSTAPPGAMPRTRPTVNVDAGTGTNVDATIDQ